MNLERRFASGVSRRAVFGIALFAGLLIPTIVGITNTKARAAADDDAPAAAAKSEFPYSVPFEQGATRFLKDDKITILEVRGTAETFAPGNIYWIKGTYQLGSHDRASLAAYITATDAEHGKSATLKVQTTVVNQGDGTFTLYFPMYHRGLPHVSFYPANGGESFGGNYFGTGDSVLKRWWGTKETD